MNMTEILYGNKCKSVLERGAVYKKTAMSAMSGFDHGAVMLFAAALS